MTNNYKKVILLGTMVCIVFCLSANTFLSPFLSFLNTAPLMDEICDNGIDDDGDGLVDCYDPDCCEDGACSNFYYKSCELDCTAPPEAGNINASVAWTSPNNSFHQQSTAIIADLDNDGEVEIIGRPQSQTGDFTKNLNVINGTTGAIETTIITPWMYFSLDGPVVGDLDRNGFVDIVVLTGASSNNSAAERRRFVCYEYDGTTYNQKWISNTTAGTDGVEQTGTSGGMADFNGDGLAELYHENKVFDGQTGMLLAYPDTGTNTGKGISGSFTSGISIAADVLPDAFCADCAGLELVIGDQVLAVTIDPVTPANNTMYVASETTTDLGDGYVSLADVDNDGDLDAVINGTTSSEGQFFIWDMQTSSQIYTTYNYTNAPLFSSQRKNSQVAVADFDGDGTVEFAFTTRSTIQVLKWIGNWTELWSQGTNDFINGGAIVPSAFDFNGDGTYEIVYRGATTFRIVDIVNNETHYSNSCSSTTGFEVVTIADIDGDDEAEVLCACGGAVRAYQSSGDPWMNARPIWNQHSYFNVNINDDLTIPIEQQNHHLVGNGEIMNNFLCQFSQNINPIPDATVVIDSSDCLGNNITLHVTICNQGDADLATNIPISIYNSDPLTTSATLLSSQTTSQVLVAAECIVASYTFAHNNNEDFYAVINDDNSTATPYDLATDFSVTTIIECDYTNNLSPINVPMSAPVPNLGNDITSCTISETLNPGTFDSYTWQDGSTNPTFTATTVGTYWVDVSNGCGGSTRDSLVISSESLNDSTFVDLCEGNSYNFDGDIITTATTLCKNYTSTTGCDSTHCVLTTLINITRDTFLTSVCEGNTYDFDGEILSTDTTVCKTYTSLLTSCDSISCVRLSITPNINTTEDITQCEGTTYDFDGETISNDTTVCKTYTSSITGCDSTHCITTIFTPLLNTTENVEFCAGNSYDFDGEIITNDTTVCKTYTSTITNCDSTHCITATLIQATNSGETVDICMGNSYDFDGEMINNDTTVCKSYTSVITGCDSIHCVTAMIIQTINSVEDVAFCQGDSYDFDGEIITNDTTICKTYTSAITNCDSIHCVTTTVNPPSTINQTLNLCEGTTYDFDGEMITNDTTICKNYTGINGCDSTHCVITSFTASLMDSTFVELCEGNSYNFDGEMISNDTTVCKSYTSINNCDSIHCVIATIITTINTTQMVNICAGDSYDFDGEIITNDTTICKNYTSINGCDSIHCLTTTLLISSNTTQSVGICEGDSYDFDGEIITNDTTICKNYTSVITGCDSIHCVMTTITTSLMDSTFVSICDGDIYDFDGTPISTESTICKNYTSFNGCDSIHCAVVSIITPITINQPIDICDGSSYDFDGDIITTATTICKDYTTINGCDSTHCIISTIIQSASDTTDVELCGSATYDFNGIEINSDTTVCIAYPSASGCDSMSCVRATVIPLVQDTIMASICDGDSYEFNGVFISNDTLLCRDLLVGNGCFSTHCIQVSIYEVTTLNPTTANTSCVCDGVISLAPTGVPPFSYQWSSGETVAQLANLCPNTYSVTMTDGNGCTQDSSFTIISTTALLIDYLATNVSCSGDDNGSIEVMVNNGLAPFTYEWSSPISSTTAIANSLVGGIYGVTVTDNNGCIAMIDNIEITAPVFPLELSLESSNPGCSDFAQGMVEAIVDNGSAPYSYAWNTGDTTEALIDVEEGIYSITVTDANGCSINASTELTSSEGMVMIINTNDNPCYRGEEASITIDSVYGGTPPYSYSLDNVVFYDNNVFSGLSTGDYTIYIQDIFGCMTQQEVTITEGLELPVDLNAVSTIDLGDSTQIEIIGNLPPNVTYEWSPPFGLSCTDCLDPIASPAETTTYTLTFTDSLGCVTQRAITITVMGELQVFVPNAFTPNGDGVNDLLVVRATSGVNQIRSFYIFDRWGGFKFGKENFVPNDDAFGWDGIFNGQKLNPNVFAFIMEVEYQDGTTEIIRGDITLMR